MYAILRQGGRQYRVAPGDTIQIDLISAEAGSAITLEDVLAIRNGDDFVVGEPRVSGAAVKATVKTHGRGVKIRIHKFKRRQGYMKKQGHRQPYTEVTIDSITLNGKSLG